jgi:hypothetical protein
MLDLSSAIPRVIQVCGYSCSRNAIMTLIRSVLEGGESYA